MALVDAKFIDNINSVIIPLFAPSILEGQSVTCFIDEEMTPYYVLGDNILVDIPAREAVLSSHLTAEQVLQKYIELPDSCDTDKPIRLYLQGLLMAQGSDWVLDNNVNPAVISWDKLGFDGLVQEGDNLLVHFWERS